MQSKIIYLLFPFFRSHRQKTMKGVTSLLMMVLTIAGALSKYSIDKICMNTLCLHFANAFFHGTLTKMMHALTALNKRVYPIEDI